MKNVNLRKILLYVLFISLVAFFFSYTIPLMIREHEKNKIMTEISQIELQIEHNKQQRLNCSNNMEMWNNDNDKNRKMIDELKSKYNEMVGFTGA